MVSGTDKPDYSRTPRKASERKMVLVGLGEAGVARPRGVLLPGNHREGAGLGLGVVADRGLLEQSI